jgi:hypothetical protein
MSIEISIDKTRNLLTATMVGLVSVDSFIHALEAALQEEPHFPAGFSALIDMREAVHGASSDDIGNLADYLAHEPRLVGSKGAIVVTKTVTYGLMRMLQMHTDDAPMTMSVFYEMDEAERWLGLAS